MKKYSFKNDYSEPAHPRVLKALSELDVNNQYVGYGLDEHSVTAQDLIRREIGQKDADVHFIAGGTHANLIVHSSLLRSKDAVLASETGHINIHEAGAIEAVGNKIVVVENTSGKVSVDSILEQIEIHQDEHMVQPKMIYISQATELGTIYSHKELKRLREICNDHDLYLFIDGARVAAAIGSKIADFSLKDIAEVSDIFYIGGTKNGAIYGEAIVVVNTKLQADFRRYIKQRGGLLAKSFAIGVQFEELFKDGLYYELGSHSNEMAGMLINGLVDLGVEFEDRSPTNQIFPTFPNSVIEQLDKMYDFYVWTPGEDKSQIRLVTSWATKPEHISEFIEDVSKLI